MPGSDTGRGPCTVCGSDLVDGRCSRCGVGPDEATIDGSQPTVAGPPMSSSAGVDPRVARREFGDRYQITEKLGTGGLGTVYQAWDRVLNIPVALKILHGAEGGGTGDADRRLKQELLLARQITHKNVVRIHDIGQAEGVSYITMPYIKGGDLATRLTRNGPLPIGRALGLARQIVAGLAAAHEAGVVHRDLKPANVLVDHHDHAIIVDFGIAHSISTTVQTMTAEGVIKGTVAYMAPEQAMGGSVDQRTDIYSFGLVLYEMLAGRRAEADANSLQDLIQRTKQPPPAVRTLNGQIPPALDAIVSRCLEPDPAKRFQNSAELSAALDALDDQGRSASISAQYVEHVTVAPVAVAPKRRRSVVVGVALLGVAVAAGVATWLQTRGREPAPPATQTQTSLLVANFSNTTGDAVFDGTVEEALTIGLESASFLNAFSRREATRLAALVAPGAPLDEQTARLVAIREGIDLVIGGGVDADGQGYRLHVRGINPDSGAVTAQSERSVSTKDRVLETIGQLAREVRRALGEVPLEASDQRSSEAPETFTAATLDAAHAYTEAQRLAEVGRDNEAVALYSKAVALDPNFGRAFSGLGVSYLRLGRLEDARTAWNKALSLVDRMTERERYRTLGLYAQQISGNYEQAIENNRALVERYPGDSIGFNNLAVAYFNTLDFNRALQAGRRAIELNPRRVRFRSNEALYAMYASDFGGARRAATEAIGLDATYAKAYLPLAMAALDGGDVAGSRGAYERMSKSGGRPGASLAAAGLADLALFAGRAADTLAPLQAAIAVDKQDGNTLGMTSKFFSLAEAQLAVDRPADAMTTLDAALTLSRRDIDLVAASRLLIQAGRRPQAAKLTAELNARLPSQGRAYARLVEGWLAADAGKSTDAVAAFQEARKLADFWLVKFGLGVAYVQAGAYAEAFSELDACQRRRGEATAVFLDDVPTARFLATLPYWLGRAQEGLGQRGGAVSSYERFLSRRADADPLIIDARRRLAGLK